MKHIKKLFYTVSILVLVLALCAACKLPDEDYFASLDQDQVVTGETTITAMPEATATQIQPSETEVSDTPEPTATPSQEAETDETKFGLTLNRNFTGEEVPIHIISFGLDDTGENIVVQAYTSKELFSKVIYTREEYDQIISDGYLDLTMSTWSYDNWAPSVGSTFVEGEDMETNRYYVLCESDLEHGITLDTDRTALPWGYDSYGHFDSDNSKNSGAFQLYPTKSGEYVLYYGCYENCPRLVDEYVELTIPGNIEIIDMTFECSNGTALEQYNYFMSKYDENSSGYPWCFFNNKNVPQISAANGIVTSMYDFENECAPRQYYVIKDATINP